ncbi:hypothetical protein ABEB36_014068 [Hypothenemus hampei]|uniref:Uncharacterized protein n=1 Tax=Hypothenemus hampei TaxID=57062 RepID=A0ABD1E3H8_HYPHA
MIRPHEDFKLYREHKSRKCSREKTNEDMLNWFLISSDPVITEERVLPKKELQHLSEEAKALLEIYNDLPKISQLPLVLKIHTIGFPSYLYSNLKIHRYF